jgi:hypothetical protein
MPLIHDREIERANSDPDKTVLEGRFVYGTGDERVLPYVVIDWNSLGLYARRARRNKAGKAVVGPLTIYAEAPQ